VEGDELRNSLTPISLGAGKLMGTFGVVVMAAAAMVAFSTTANAGILAASRSPMAMSRDQLLPAWIEKTHPRFGTPHVSILLTCAFMIAIVLFSSVETLAKTASTLKLLLFAFVNIAVVVMRQSKLSSYRPMFRSPLYPWIQIAGVIGYVFLIIEMGIVPLLITGMFTVLSVAWYYFYGRPRVTRRSALVGMVKRISDKELGDGSLAAELKSILLERDEIVEDRFDRLVDKCPILDVSDSMPAEEMFRQVAAQLSPRLGVGEDILFQRFVKREKESQTVVRAGVAIPHLMVEGEKKFEILMVRCKAGIDFPESPEPVHAVFVLVGTRDERNFHLCALMAVAQVTNEADFDRNWLRARNTTELRHVVLLTKRRRGCPT
jgi:mannitol/fructose-specific phosphotransferase system IIA component (Ntr-type)